MKPWEKFQSSESKPWEKFQKEQPESVNMIEGALNMIEGALRSGLQGLTFGFGDELTAGVGALPTAAMTDMSVPEAYSSLLAQEREKIGQFRQESPVTSIASEIAGGLGTGIAGAGTKSGQVIAKNIGASGLGSKIAKTAGLAGLSGGLYGYGSGEGEDRLRSAQEAAALSATIGGAVPAVGRLASNIYKGAPTAIKGLSARTGEQLIDEAGKLKSGAVELRNQARLSDVYLKPEDNQKLVENLNKSLSEIELIPELSPKTLAIVGRIKEKAELGDINLNQIDQYRRLLRSARDEDSVAAGAVRRALDDAVNNLTVSGKDRQSIELLNQFRQDYSKASKFEDVAEIVSKSGGDPNKIKSGLNRFLQKKDNIRGFSEDELKALRDAAEMTSSEKVLKGLGRFGIDPGNVFLPLVGSGVAGFGFGTPVAAATVGLGTAARFLQKNLAKGKAEELLQIIENGGKIPQKEAFKLKPKVYKFLEEKGLVK